MRIALTVLALAASPFLVAAGVEGWRKFRFWRLKRHVDRQYREWQKQQAR